MNNNVGTATGINPAKPVLQAVVVLYVYVQDTLVMTFFWQYSRIMVVEVNFVPDNGGDNNWHCKCGLESVTSVNKLLTMYFKLWFSLGACPI